MPSTIPAQLDHEDASRRPPGHRAHAAAWTAVLGPEQQTIAYVQLGVQHPSAEPAAEAVELLRRLRGLLSGQHGPALLDFAYELDAAGHRNDLLLAYWTSPEEEAQWWARADVERLWSRELEVGVGLWREALRIDADRFETLHSSDRGAQGVSSFAPIEPTAVHEYDGAARDRIARSRTDPLDGAPTVPDPAPGADGPTPMPRAPENLCFIRTAQDWSRCTDSERTIYLERVAPALARGARYLRDNPTQTGCMSGRFVQELDDVGTPLPRTCFLGYFASLADLERWTWSHQTHAAIFGSFMELVRERGGQVDLALWHEVCVLPADCVELDYRNCHPRTGLLASGVWSGRRATGSAASGGPESARAR